MPFSQDRPSIAVLIAILVATAWSLTATAPPAMAGTGLAACAVLA